MPGVLTFIIFLPVIITSVPPVSPPSDGEIPVICGAGFDDTKVKAFSLTPSDVGLPVSFTMRFQVVGTSLVHSGVQPSIAITLPVEFFTSFTLLSFISSSLPFVSFLKKS